MDFCCQRRRPLRRGLKNCFQSWLRGKFIILLLSRLTPLRPNGCIHSTLRAFWISLRRTVRIQEIYTRAWMCTITRKLCILHCQTLSHLQTSASARMLVFTFCCRTCPTTSGVRHFWTRKYKTRLRAIIGPLNSWPGAKRSPSNRCRAWKNSGRKYWGFAPIKNSPSRPIATSWCLMKRSTSSKSCLLCSIWSLLKLSTFWTLTTRSERRSTELRSQWQSRGTNSDATTSQARWTKPWKSGQISQKRVANVCNACNPNSKCFSVKSHKSRWTNNEEKANLTSCASTQSLCSNKVSYSWIKGRKKTL